MLKYKFKYNIKAISQAVIAVFTIVLLSLQGYSQPSTIRVVDSVNLHETLLSFFKAVENNDAHGIKELSLDSVYCIMCDRSMEVTYPPDNYIVPIETIISEMREQLLLSVECYNKRGYHFIKSIPAKSNFMVEQSEIFIEVVIPILIKDEEAPVHEGAQYCLQFVKREGIFLFCGLDSIP